MKKTSKMENQKTSLINRKLYKFINILENKYLGNEQHKKKFHSMFSGYNHIMYFQEIVYTYVNTYVGLFFEIVDPKMVQFIIYILYHE